MPRAALASSATFALGCVPGPDRIANWVAGPRRWSAALFHHLASHEDALTAGLGVTVTPSAFETWLDHCEERFTFVGLDDLSSGEAFSAPKPPLLLTFDDAYASVAREAAPRLARRGIPSLFFVNGRFLDNAYLALDNLLAAVINLKGAAQLERVLPGPATSVDEILTRFVSKMTLAQRQQLHENVQIASGLDAAELLARFRPYLTANELQTLPGMGMEIGNHTWSHVHTRALDSEAVSAEISQNQRLLQSMTDDPIRAFAFPYGRDDDATPAALAALDETGHEHVFMVQGRLNGDRLSGPSCRVAVHARSNQEAIRELELLPIARSLRYRIEAALE